MKKTLTINLNNIVFNIDEDAYNELNIYLNQLSNHFKNIDGGSEIISDIESRVSEILHEKINKFKEVININDISYVIETLGKPETIINEEEPVNNTENEKYSSPKKRVYRDIDNRIIGGVCSGIAAYFGIDVVIVRIIMILSLFAFSFLIYIVLWIVTPAALTTAQKLEMKGEKVNISNIEKKIKDEFNDVKENLKNIKYSKHYKQSESVFQNIIGFITQIVALFFNTFGNVIGFVFKALGRLLGVIFILIGSMVLLAFLGTFIFDNWGINGINSISFLSLFLDSADITLLTIGLIIIIAIPIISIIYGGFKLLFRFRIETKTFGIIGFIAWIFGLSLIIITSYSVIKQNKIRNTYTEKINHIEIKSDTIFISKWNTDEMNYENLFNLKHVEYALINDSLKIALKPEIIIQRNDSNYIDIEIEKKSFGTNKLIALDNAKKIIYKYQIKDNKIQIDNKIIIDNKLKWKNQSVKILINIPKNKELIIDETLSNLI